MNFPLIFFFGMAVLCVSIILYVGFKEIASNNRKQLDLDAIEVAKNNHSSNQRQFTLVANASEPDGDKIDRYQFENQKSTALNLDKIDWFQFEKVIAKLLSLEGFSVERKGGSKKDGGIDIVCRHNIGNKTHLIQCKFWKTWDLNLKTLRELLGSRECSEFKNLNAKAFVYTLSDPTNNAIEFAKDNNIGIVTRPEIEERLNKFPIHNFPELIDPSIKFCPKCDAPLVNRGTFWGCSNYGRMRCYGKIQGSKNMDSN